MNNKILTIGHACVDFVHTVDAMPTNKFKADSCDMRSEIGGPAGRTAVLLKILGADVKLCTVSGDHVDNMSALLCTLLAKLNIGALIYNVLGEIGATSNILVLPNGDRFIASYQSSAIVNHEYVINDLASFDFVLGDTYRLPMVKASFEIANQAGIPTMLDVDKPIADISTIPKATYTWFSHEATNGMPIERWHKLIGGFVGVTNGPGPVQWIDELGVYHEYTFEPLAVKNTLGAGDVFRAALALCLCNKVDMTTAVQTACKISGEYIMGNEIKKLTGEFN